MSTEIFLKNGLHVISYCGENGLMTQFTPQFKEFAQLDKKCVRELVTALNKWLEVVDESEITTCDWDKKNVAQYSVTTTGKTLYLCQNCFNRFMDTTPECNRLHVLINCVVKDGGGKIITKYSHLLEKDGK